jgi:uncharacterized protein (TIGR00288 family)
VIDNLSRRGTAEAYPGPLRNAPNAALLIDFDNVTMGVRSDLQIQLKRMLNSDIFKGKISVQRAYADWRRYPQYIVPLSEASIDLIFAPAFGSNKKNATDIRLAIDALELVFTRPEIGTYILLSGDSDFSSLVLKLKEYGKYVIGVGIRESSSDLLIQNCDEYYGYSELTGLLKEGEVEQRRRDPWELVVTAASRMQQSEDVMRSDRLKQVMQEIDPNFDEKDAGFSKYSKFLQESARRGLHKLVKLENGQYEIALGTNANVPPDVEQAARESAAVAERAPAPRRRGGRSRAGGSPAAVAEGMSLAQAFEVLRRALTDVGAVGEESTDADQTRERMVELSDADDPLFEPRRFQRFLRQAHDANLIELVKSGDGAYLLRLQPVAAEGEPQAGGTNGDGDDRPGRRRRGERGGRSRRGGRRRSEDDAEADEGGHRPAARTELGAVQDAETRPGLHEETPQSRAAPGDGTRREGDGRRNPRFRRGSRSRSGAGDREGGELPAAPAQETPRDPVVSGPVSHHRSLRGRGGRRGHAAGGPGGPPHPSADSATAEPAAAAPPPPAPPIQRERPPAPPPPERAPVLEESAGEESGGLFKRMSAALQRAMLGQQKDRPPDE